MIPKLGRPKPADLIHFYVHFGETESYASSDQNATIGVKVVSAQK